MRRPHAVSDRAVAADAEILKYLVTSFQAGLAGRIGIWNFAPAFGDVVRQPFDVVFRTALVSLNGFLFPVKLPLHAVVSRFESQALDITGQRHEALATQPLERRHNGAGSRIARIDEMRHVPVIRVFTAFLGKIDPGALGTQQDGFVGNIVSGLGNALRTVGPIESANRLAVAVNTSVLNIDLASGGFRPGAGTEDFRRRHIARRIRPVDHGCCDGGQQSQKTDEDNSWRHFHIEAPRLKYRLRITLYNPI